MTVATSVLLRVRSAGGQVSVVGNRLSVEADAELPDDLWQALADHKDDLLALLTAPSDPVAVLREIHAAGGTVVADGKRLALHLPDGITDETLDRLAAARDGIHRHLTETAWEDPFTDRQLPPPAGFDRCDRCRSPETVDREIHGGDSIRQDCAVCGRFRKFTRWHGVEMP